MKIEKGVNIWEDNLIFSRELMSSNRLFGKFNKVLIRGRIVEDLKYNHNYDGIKFYESTVKVKKDNKINDLIPIIVLDELMTSIGNSIKDKFVEIAGQFITRFTIEKDDKRHSISKILVSDIKFLDDQDELEVVDEIYLEGCILDPPRFYKDKEKMITSFRIEVPRRRDITDYIRCVGYGFNSLRSNEYVVGDKVKIYGTLISREYFKKAFSNSNQKEKRISYEVKIIFIEKV